MSEIKCHKLVSSLEQIIFSNFSCMFLSPNCFCQFELNCSNFIDLRNLQEQVKRVLCCKKLFWPFTDQANCSNYLKIFANTRPSALNFKSFSWSLQQLFLTVGQNNFCNKSIIWQFCIKCHNLVWSRLKRKTLHFYRTKNVFLQVQVHGG